MLKIRTNRQLGSHKSRLLCLSDEAYKWLQTYAQSTGKSISLIVELIIRSRALNKRLDHLIDFDLLRELPSQTLNESISNPDIVQPDIVQELTQYPLE